MGQDKTMFLVLTFIGIVQFAKEKELIQSQRNGGKMDQNKLIVKVGCDCSAPQYNGLCLICWSKYADYLHEEIQELEKSEQGWLESLNALIRINKRIRARLVFLKKSEGNKGKEGQCQD